MVSSDGNLIVRVTQNQIVGIDVAYLNLNEQNNTSTDNQTNITDDEVAPTIDFPVYAIALVSSGSGLLVVGIVILIYMKTAKRGCFDRRAKYKIPKTP